MDLESLRVFCLSLPDTDEKVQWGDNLLYRIGGKMFAITNFEGIPKLSFKCGEERFHELLERPDIIPAPYLARAKWVQLQHLAALPGAELRALLTEAYELIKAKLPKLRRSCGMTEAGAARRNPETKRSGVEGARRKSQASKPGKPKSTKTKSSKKRPRK